MPVNDVAEPVHNVQAPVNDVGEPVHIARGARAHHTRSSFTSHASPCTSRSSFSMSHRSPLMLS